jgi:dimeric dUTPase (all-alpha-NTP-PPase superfamily)
MLKWNNLKAIQRELDMAIMKPRNLSYGSTFEDRKIAALVELGETANEVRFFKFWSQKGPSGREVILEELVDVLHFVLSLLNCTEGTFGKVEPWLSGNTLSCFMALYRIIPQYSRGQEFNMACLFEGLCVSLGFQPEEIEEAYMAKNRVNYKRQEEGY